MNRKFLYLIMVIVLIIAISIGIFISTNKRNNENTNNINISNENATIQESNNKENNQNITTNSNNNILVTYFSATGTTQNIAEYIAEETNGKLIEIVPKEKYSPDDLNYNNDDCRANKEQNDENARPEIENSIDFDDYDIIFIGYPIWWGDVPKIILTLLGNYNLDGKTVIPFCTSGGSEINQSENTLKSYNTNINWLGGKRFSSSSTKSEVSTWIQDLNIK